jgi:F0F1-type ATP synthase assembly protein I
VSQKRPSRARNLALAAVAAQAGCATIIIIILALLIGLWLDAQFGVRGLFTIGVLVLSVPLTLFIMLRIALGAAKRIIPQPEIYRRKDESQEGEL